MLGGSKEGANFTDTWNSKTNEINCRSKLKTPLYSTFQKILTVVSLYILGVTCYLKRHHQPIELNLNIHAYNTRRKMDIHIQSYRTDLYNKFPYYIKETESYKSFRKKLKSFLLWHTFMFSTRICSSVTMIIS